MRLAICKKRPDRRKRARIIQLGEKRPTDGAAAFSELLWSDQELAIGTCDG
jgi:hypothetical protein